MALNCFTSVLSEIESLLNWSNHKVGGWRKRQIDVIMEFSSTSRWRLPRKSSGCKTLSSDARKAFSNENKNEVERVFNTQHVQRPKESSIDEEIQSIKLSLRNRKEALNTSNNFRIFVLQKQMRKLNHEKLLHEEISRFTDKANKTLKAKRFSE